MKKETSCGIFLYDSTVKKLLCCKPFRGKVDFWTIPKGRIDKEDADCFAAAIRELYEETSIELNKLDYFGPFPLETSQYKHGKKQLESFLIISKKPLKDLQLKCLSFYENDKGKFPEIGGYFWFTLEAAADKLHYTQSKLIPAIQLVLEKKNVN